MKCAVCRFPVAERDSLPFPQLDSDTRAHCCCAMETELEARRAEPSLAVVIAERDHYRLQAQLLSAELKRLRAVVAALEKRLCLS